MIELLLTNPQLCDPAHSTVDLLRLGETLLEDGGMMVEKPLVERPSEDAGPSEVTGTSEETGNSETTEASANAEPSDDAVPSEATRSSESARYSGA